jgi:uncharacterized repeat protein (TIGR03803 family)
MRALAGGVSLRLAAALIMVSFSGAAQTLTTLYSFVDGSNAAFPSAGVVAATNGKLFGTTAYGGANGFGAAYELTPGAGGTWSETLLYGFQGGSDGAIPDAPLTLGPSGAYYGTTFAGGSSGNGTVFELKPPAQPGGAWTETVLYSFKGGNDGSGPKAAVTVGAKGVLYGTTFGGGTGNAGTVFLLTPPAGGVGPWTESVIYSFKGAGDGNGPQAPVTLNQGNLYGTTCCGTPGGTVFRLSHAQAGAWTKATLFNFATYATGAFPSGNLAIDTKGVLYGVTTAGGPSQAGIAFSLTPVSKGKPYKLTTIHSFTNGTDGGAPYGGVVLLTSGTLYVSVTAGCNFGVGGVAQFVPPTGSGAWTETVLYSFMGASDGSQPQGIVLGSNNALFGATGFDGAAGYGTVFELIP